MRYKREGHREGSVSVPRQYGKRKAVKGVFVVKEGESGEKIA